VSHASVPFRYDIHVLLFAEDAVTIEQDFTSAWPTGASTASICAASLPGPHPMRSRPTWLELAGELFEFNDVAEALEYRQSLHQLEPAVVSG
jgi:hypothetical protein